MSSNYIALKVVPLLFVRRYYRNSMAKSNHCYELLTGAALKSFPIWYTLAPPTPTLAK